MSRALVRSSSLRSVFGSVCSLALVLGFSLSVLANGPDGEFPLHPDPTITPGALCTTGTTKRYPEGITYCERQVDRDLKRDLFRRYDVTLGYETQTLPRADFKIDHFIPLCAGGANSAENLWPQHKSVYAVTDPVEPLICEKMSEGVLKQAEAVELVKKAKYNLDQVPAVLADLNGLGVSAGAEAAPAVQPPSNQAPPQP